MAGEDKASTVFGGDSKVETREHKGELDKLDPNWGRLKPQQINTKSSINGAKAAVDSTVVFGDMAVFIQQGRTTKIVLNDDSTIQGDWTKTVDGKSVHNLVSGRDIEVGIYDKLAVQGTQQKMVTDLSRDTFLSQHEQDVPLDFETKAQEYTGVGFEAAVRGVCVEGKALTTEIFGVTRDFGLVELKTKAWKEHILGEDGAVHALKDGIGNILDLVFRGDGLIDIGDLTPFR